MKKVEINKREEVSVQEKSPRRGDLEGHITNRVTESGIIQFDLEELYPVGERVLFDLKDYLFEDLILKEKDFREKLKQLDLNFYKSKYVAVTCTADAIIPTWAYMLVASVLQPVVKKTVFGDLMKLEENIFSNIIQKLNPEDYREKRVVIKGCSERVPVSAYVDLTNFLAPVVKSIMFGEPCSTVPVFKK